MSEIPSNNTEKILISSLDSFKRELWLSFSIQELDFDPFRTTRQALDSLLLSLRSITDQQAKKVEIQRFIQEQKENERENIQSDAREGLSNIATWIWLPAIPWVWWLAGGIWGAWVSVITAGLMAAYVRKNPEASGWDKTMHSISAWWEAVSYVTMRFIHKTPIGGILRYFGFKEPENPLEDLLPDTQAVTESVQEKVDTARQSLENIPAIPFWNTQKLQIFVTLFSASNAVNAANEKLQADRKLERMLCGYLFWRDDFATLRYNDITSGNIHTIVDRIYKEDAIPETIKNAYPPEAIKNHIRAILLNIWWGIYTNNAQQNFSLRTWWDLIAKSFHENTWQDIRQGNPTMNELFSKIHNFESFKGFLDANNFDPAHAIESLQSKTSQMFQSISVWWGNITAEEFSEMAWSLPSTLRGSRENFIRITRWILWVQWQRLLSQDFWLVSGTTRDTLEEDTTTWEFIQNTLLPFGKAIHTSVVTAENPVKWLSESQKNLSLRDVYELYIIMWWQTNPENLSSIRQLQLSSYLIFKWREQDTPEKIAEITNSLMNAVIDGVSTGSQYVLTPNVRNFLGNIGGAATDLWIETAKFSWSVLWELGKRNPIVAFGGFALLAAVPFITRRTNLISILRGR